MDPSSAGRNLHFAKSKRRCAQKTEGDVPKTQENLRHCRGIQVAEFYRRHRVRSTPLPCNKSRRKVHNEHGTASFLCDTSSRVFCDNNAEWR